MTKDGRIGNPAIQISPILSRQREIGRDSLIQGSVKYVFVTSVFFLSTVLVIGVLLLVSLVSH